VLTASDGIEGLRRAQEEQPDLILLDIMMPGIDGLEVCRRLRAGGGPFIPVILVTAKAGKEDVVEGLEAGADDYVTKPIDPVELMARVRAALRVKAMQDEITRQAEELAVWNARLEERVAAQVAELEQLGRLKRYFSPALTTTILAGNAEELLRHHRREVTVAFLDLRGFTAFSGSTEPEEVMDVLAAYHARMGRLIFEYDGTLERFAGDGIMVFFNDPIPCKDHTARAVRMALEMQGQARELREGWLKRGYDLHLGIGIAVGYATLGQIGFEGRRDYAAIGPVTNLASRLSGEAGGGEILISQRVWSAVESLVEAEAMEEVSLKGFPRLVGVYRVVGLREGV
jgi:class 3 adenylate cyclase